MRVTQPVVLACCLIGLSLVPVSSVPVSQKGRAREPRFSAPTPNQDYPLPAISLSSQDENGFRQFVDSHGRIRVFHGVNAVVKGPPWYPSIDKFDFQTSLVDHDFEILAAAGVTVIRLGTMWAGVEPVRGQYNTTYINILVEMARNASKYGIYTLLDMHQDVMSEKFCGEGLPAWAVQPSGSFAFPEPVKGSYKIDPATGFPSNEDCQKMAWSRYYFAEATGTAFQALYDNKDGLLDAWAGMWGTVAAAFKGETHILGAELINEPWAGDVVHDPLLMVPGHADKENLQGVYDKLAAAVWQADPDRLVFFAGVTWDNLGNGFTHAPTGAGGGEKSVLAYHYYEYPMGPQLKNSSAAEIAIALRDAGRLGTGAMLTEFGEPGFSDGSFQGAAASAEALGQSWACWEYKTFCKQDPASHSQEGSYGACKTGYGGQLWTEEGGVRTTSYAALARPYATAVAGRVGGAKWDAEARVFSLQFEPAPAAPAPTVVKVPTSVHYAGGFKVVVVPPNAATWTQPDPSTFIITPDLSQPEGTIIAFTVSPATAQAVA